MALNSDQLKEDSGYIKKDKKNNAKIEKEGDLCRKCNIPVLKRIAKKKNTNKKKSYFFKYYLICPNCGTIYYTEDAKQEINQNNINTLFG